MHNQILLLASRRDEDVPVKPATAGRVVRSNLAGPVRSGIRAGESRPYGGNAMRTTRGSLVAASLLLTSVACQREEREFRPSPEWAETLRFTRMSDLEPGPRANPPPSLSKSRATVPSDSVKNPFSESAFAVSEGKRSIRRSTASGATRAGAGGWGHR